MWDTNRQDRAPSSGALVTLWRSCEKPWVHDPFIKLACRLLFAGGRLIEHEDMAEKEAAYDGKGTMLLSTP